MKDTRFELLLTSEDRAAWQRSANLAGISLAAYVRRCVEEAQALEHVLELQIADAHREQEHRRMIEAEPAGPRAPRRSLPQPGLGRYGTTIGEALQAADRSAGRSGSLL